MNETACTFVCAIVSAIAAILYFDAMKSGDFTCLPVATCLTVVASLISGFVIVCRYM
jgi:hypothetical protein